MAEKDKLVPVTVAARLLTISRRTVYEMLEDGRLTLIRAGKKCGYRVKVSELERIVGEPVEK